MMNRTAQDNQFQRYKQRIQETYREPAAQVHCRVNTDQWIEIESGVTA